MTRILRWLSAAIAFCRAAMQRRRQRQSLARLDDHLLRDIGVTRRDASREVRKLF